MFSVANNSSGSHAYIQIELHLRGCVRGNSPKGWVYTVRAYLLHARKAPNEFVSGGRKGTEKRHRHARLFIGCCTVLILINPIKVLAPIRTKVYQYLLLYIQIRYGSTNAERTSYAGKAFGGWIFLKYFLLQSMYYFLSSWEKHLFGWLHNALAFWRGQNLPIVPGTLLVASFPFSVSGHPND